MFLFINSNDPAHTSNTPWDFSVSLHTRPYIKEGTWECALTEFWLKDVDEIEEDLYVYADFLTYSSLMNGTKSNILRIIRSEGEVANPYFMPLKSMYAAEGIRVYIRRKDGSIPTMKAEEATCVLEMRAVE